MRIILLGTLILSGPAFAEDVPSQRFRADQAQNSSAIAASDAVTERSNYIGRQAIASMCVGCGVASPRETQPPPRPPVLAR